MLFRGSMGKDLRYLQQEGGLEGARAWWSLWKGYLDEPSGLATREMLDGFGVPLDVLHTSGHASIADLNRLKTAIAAHDTKYMHTNHPDAASLISGM